MKRYRQFFSAAFLVQGALGLIVSGLLLSACGGGGSGGGSPGGYTPAPPGAPSNSGSVSASFAVSGASATFYLAPASGALANAATTPAASAVQSAGAMLQLGDYILTLSPVTQDISGDANYAMGRWVWGTVKSVATSAVLDTMNGSTTYDAWHYVLVNTLASLPPSGSKTCDAGTFTTPTYIAGGTFIANTGLTTSSNPTLSFSATGATVNFTLTTKVGGALNAIAISASNVAASTSVLSGSMGAGNSGAWIYLSDGGAGRIRINGIYNNTVGGSGTFQGAYTFLCI